MDTYSKHAHAKIYTTKTPITAAELLNDRVLPFIKEHDLPVLRILTDRGTEYCGKAESHDYQVTFRKTIYQSIEDLQVDLDEWLDHDNNKRTTKEKCAAEEHRMRQ